MADNQRIYNRRYVGTHQHKLRRLTTSVFGGLLEDLHRLEKNGYDKPICIYVAGVLKNIGQNCQKLANSPWMKQIAMDFGDFHTAYEKWNKPGNNTSIEACVDRKSHLETLIIHRKKWAKDIHKKHTRNLGGEQDIADFSDNTIEQLKKISKEYSNIFPNLIGNINGYEKRTN